MSLTIADIWSQRELVVLEREIWIAMMEYQHQHGLVSSGQIQASLDVLHKVDLPSIREREVKTKHDLKARLDEFAELSGHERIHLGMTSADIVENTYIIRIRRSIEALGLQDYLGHIYDDQLFRGIRGPVGSDVDQMDLLNGVYEDIVAMNEWIASRFGLMHIVNAMPQCMPRSYDVQIAAALVRCVANVSGRIVANGYLTMLSGQEYWLEGDVATSVVRRYAWPNLFEVVEADQRMQQHGSQEDH